MYKKKSNLIDLQQFIYKFTFPNCYGPNLNVEVGDSNLTSTCKKKNENNNLKALNR